MAIIRKNRLYRGVKPFLSAVAVVCTATALVVAIYFTELGLQWITFLTGLLVASILAEASRMSRSEWILMRRTVQLSALKDKLEHLTRLRKQNERNLAAAMSRLRLMDENIPTMVALIDSDGRCLYHNQAFRNWLNLSQEQINNRYLREILGNKIYAELATAVRQSLDGQPMSYEQTHTMPDGSVYHLLMEHVPQLDKDGNVTGFYMLANDLTGPDDVHVAARRRPARKPTPADAAAGAIAKKTPAAREVPTDSSPEEFPEPKDTSRRILAAIENGEFSLFCQLIAPLAADSGESEHYEILIRLKEEEQNMVPPGAFFPLAEKHGLMPYLDRWVVQHVLQQVAQKSRQGIQQQGSVLFINVARATIHDSEFPNFIATSLQENGIAGNVLCFEVPHAELALSSNAVAEFVRQVRMRGCKVALSGFGLDNVSFDLIRGFRIDFIKIDGSVIFNLLREPAALARVVAIDRIAKKIGVKMVAEMVESEETIEKLRETGIDFAQGFGISRPRPFGE